MKFWDKVDVQGPHDCWEWQAYVAPTGYGQLTANNKTYYAHRISHQIHTGKKPKNYILHHCDNRRCVNPAHLFEGTQKDNIDDMLRKGRGYQLPRQSGETHPSARLVQDDVDDIREQYEQGGITYADLARQYGCSIANIGYIVKRGSWND